MNAIESKTEPKPIFTCYCCGTTYERGRFRCCAPKDGMKAYYWQALWCATCNKCPNHCLCETRVQRDPGVRRFNEMTPIRKLASEFQGKIWKRG